VARLRTMLGHDLPALVLTGDISAETLGEVARQGYVQRSKPVRAEELTRLVRSLLTKP
jgi:two-component system, chemotaxis family, CheB/CheR fusion protein